MKHDQVFKIESAELREHNWYFTVRLDVASCESVLDGYFVRDHGEFRITNTHSSTVGDLAVVLTWFAAKKGWCADRFQEYIQDHFSAGGKPKASFQETLDAAKRLRRLDEISDACQWDKFPAQLDQAARDARGEWEAIMAVQEIYESRYC